MSLSREVWLVLSGEDGPVSRSDSVCSASSDDPSVWPAPPLPRRLLLLGCFSFSSTTVTRRPGSFRKTLADGESSGSPRRTSPSADWRLRGERDAVLGERVRESWPC